MALIKCPECKKKISDQCENCPNCGFPIKANENNHIDENATNNGSTENKTRKPFFKKLWFWGTVGILLVALIVGAVLFINRDTKPKLDKDGNPVFVELTNEVYTNANKYKGYYINITGKVFQVMGDNGTSKGIQIWLDPDTCEQNLMIYYTTNVEVKQGDYVSCSGYIDSVTKYKNAYAAEMYVPLVYSTDLKKATYMEVMAPTIESIKFENLKQDQFGYSVSIEKVEFAEKETRVYMTVVNNGNANFYIGDAVIVQNGKQYNSTSNFEADYEEIPYEIVKGASSYGIVVFSAIKASDFEISFDVHSSDFNEEFERFILKVTKDGLVQESDPVTTPPENSVPEETEKVDTTSTSPANPVNPVDRNQEAVNKAQELAQSRFPTSRGALKNALIDLSFSHLEAEYAVYNANINWSEHALGNANAYLDLYHKDRNTFHDSPNNLAYYADITAGHGFTDAERQYAINNCGINWGIAATNVVPNIKTYSRDAISPQEFISVLVSIGFSRSDAEYGVNNANFDWGTQVYYYVLDNFDSGDTKSAVIAELRQAGFTDSAIESGLLHYADEFFAPESNS